MRTTLLTICAIAYCSERSETALGEKAVKQETFGARRKPEHRDQERDQQKNLKQTQVYAGNGAFQESGTPAHDALIVKKTIAAGWDSGQDRDQIGLDFEAAEKKRRTTSLWSARATNTPAENQTTNAISPKKRHVVSPKWSKGFSRRLKSIVVSLGALRARATAKQFSPSFSTSAWGACLKRKNWGPNPVVLAATNFVATAGCFAATAARALGAFFDVCDTSPTV